MIYFRERFASEETPKQSDAMKPFVLLRFAQTHLSIFGTISSPVRSSDAIRVIWLVYFQNALLQLETKLFRSLLFVYFIKFAFSCGNAFFIPFVQRIALFPWKRRPQNIETTNFLAKNRSWRPLLRQVTNPKAVIGLVRERCKFCAWRVTF